VQQLLRSRVWHVNRTHAVALGLLAVVLVVWPPAVAYAASPSPTAPAASGVGPSPSPKTAAFGLGPATAKALDDRPNYVWSVTPSGTLNDHVALVNYSTQALTLDLYARDAVNAPSGALNMQAKSVAPTDAGSWITFQIPGHTSTVTVPARSTVIVPISLVVPRDGSPGDHTAGIITSLTSKATATNGTQTINPNLEQRVAVPVEIRVAGPIHPNLAVRGLKTSYRQTLDPVGDGHATVTYHVVNTGNVNLGGHQQVSITGLFGSSVHVAVADVPVLLPGSSVAMSVPVRGVLPEFLMTTHVTLTPLVPSGNVDPGLVVTHAGKHFWAVPWVLVVILGVFGATWWQVRKRRGRSSGRHGSPSGGGRRRRGSTSAICGAGQPAGAPGGVSVTNTWGRLVGGLGAIGVSAALAAGFPAGVALAASGLPYTDQYAHGSIGFCDKAGNNIAHGSVYDKPFAWRAVSSVSAPPTLSGPGRKATLYAYQPRKGVDPANWSGQQLGAASAYSSTTVPVAQQTDRDPALSDYLNNFPPQWDQLVELRIYFGALNTPVSASAYPAADIRIVGTAWTLLNGAKVDCNAGGTVISAEAGIPASNTVGLQPPQPLSEVAAKAVGAPPPPRSASPSAASGAAGGSRSSAASSSVAAASQTVVASGSAVAPSDAASGSGGGGSSSKSHATLIVVLVVVVFAAVGGSFWRRAYTRAG
jgi:hypothetical protein